MIKIFVSYRRADSPYVVTMITDRLVDHFGSDSVFFDIDTIPLGVDFRHFINQYVAQCQVVLAIIGNDWLKISNNQGQRRLDDPTDFVRLEIEAALREDIPVIPVLVGTSTMPIQEELPKSIQNLAYRNAIEVRAGKDVQVHLRRMVQGLEDYVPQSGSKIKRMLSTVPLQKATTSRTGYFLLWILGIITARAIHLSTEMFQGQSLMVNLSTNLNFLV